MIFLGLIFFCIAIFYSIVGFGGGSSYIAFLVLFGEPLHLIPILALICNIIVVINGSGQYISRGHFSWQLTWPFIITSVPLAYLGGTLPIGGKVFQFLLAGSLLLAGARLLWSFRNYHNLARYNKISTPLAFIIGGFLGLLSGIVGIGGGIFLSPILYFLKWGKPKQIATTCAIFILINSVAGIAGQLQKMGGEYIQVVDYWPLFLMVLLGGQLGSYLGSAKLDQRPIALLTGCLILFVSLRLFVNVLN